ncbi:MAG TPA: DNA internalization-related competence protein ComEC/Rec2, partial [Usitatibacter sp.]|nr:DNA internalization-related competence protein ComEC/Rec2 [Usitatibacter sp.]
MRSFVVAFVAGSWWLQHEARLPPLDVLPFAAILLLATALVPLRRTSLRMVLAAAAGLLAGYGWAAFRADSRLADALPVSQEMRDVKVEGAIEQLPQLLPGARRFVFDVERVLTPGARVPATISLSWYGEEGEDAKPPPLAAGDRWRFTVRLRRPRGLANPHGFDLEPWALERGIRATGYVRAKPEPLRLEPRAEGWVYTLHRWRGEIRDRMFLELADARLRGVIAALAIGDQDSIAPDDWEVFWRTGVGHLMSISGLHITMLGALAAAAAYFVWVRIPLLVLAWPARKAAAVVGVAAAFGYCLMTGYAVPAQRTVLMLAAMAACVIADRHVSPSRVLALAALAVLGVDPWAAISPGFWMSFGAVAAILYAMGLRAGRGGKLAAALAEQAAVTLGMLPLLVALFQQVSLVSPIANAFAIPVVSLVVVPLSIAGAFLGVGALLQAAHLIMTWVMVPLEALAGLPAAMLESHEPAAWTVAAAFAGCLWLLAPRGVPLRSAGFAWIAPMFLVLPAAPAPGEAWLDVLDVGNGLAVVVRTANHVVVYDTGPSWSGDADSGNRIVVPFLRGEGLSHLDGVVVSHADDDHSGGAASIALLRDPGWLLSSLPPRHPLQAAFPESHRCEAGQRWSWDGVTFSVLHPAVAIYAEAGRRKENDRGCVLRVATGGASMLLAADVEARSEREMLSRDGGALGSTVLLVAHHGSKT